MFHTKVLWKFCQWRFMWSTQTILAIKVDRDWCNGLPLDSSKVVVPNLFHLQIDLSLWGVEYRLLSKCLKKMNAIHFGKRLSQNKMWTRLHSRYTMCTRTLTHRGLAGICLILQLVITVHILSNCQGKDSYAAVPCINQGTICLTEVRRSSPFLLSGLVVVCLPWDL